MDQKQLDPKLKEAYERVMGINVPPKAAGTPPPTNNPIQGPNPQPLTAPQPQSGHGTFSTPPPTQSSGFSAQQPPPAPKSFVASKSGGSKKPISPVIIAIAVVIFFVGYTFAWIKIFNVSLPFFSSGTNNAKSGTNKTVAPATPTILPTVAPTTAPTVVPTTIPTSAPAIPVSSGSAGISTSSSH